MAFSEDDNGDDQFWLDLYARANDDFRSRGVDDYLQQSNLSRLDLGLLSLPANGVFLMIGDFAECVRRMIIPPGMLDVGWYPPIGNPSLEMIVSATERLLECGLLRIAEPEDVAKSHEQMRRDVTVFPRVNAPCEGNVILNEEAQRVWIDVYHGLLAHPSERQTREQNSDSERLILVATRPIVAQDCAWWWPDEDNACRNCKNRTTVEYIGPVMDYWWHIAPNGYRMTCVLDKEDAAEASAGNEREEP